MPDYSGVTWRVNYGEIAEREQFRVGYVGMESFDAYFPVSQLADLITTLNTVMSLPLSVIARGTDVQAWKVSDGLTTDVVIGPRLDTGTPVESMRLKLTDLADFLYALGLFQTSLIDAPVPDDWDVSKLLPVAILDPKGKLPVKNLPNIPVDNLPEITGDRLPLIPEDKLPERLSDSAISSLASARVLSDFSDPDSGLSILAEAKIIASGPMIDLRKYGAVADGVTDLAVAINAALADIRTAPAPCTLYLPISRPGVFYYLGTSVNIDVPGVSLLGFNSRVRVANDAALIVGNAPVAGAPGVNYFSEITGLDLFRPNTNGGAAIPADSSFIQLRAVRRFGIRANAFTGAEAAIRVRAEDNFSVMGSGGSHVIGMIAVKDNEVSEVDYFVRAVNHVANTWTTLSDWSFDGNNVNRFYVTCYYFDGLDGGTFGPHEKVFSLDFLSSNPRRSSLRHVLHVERGSDWLSITGCHWFGSGHEGVKISQGRTMQILGLVMPRTGILEPKDAIWFEAQTGYFAEVSVVGSNVKHYTKSGVKLVGNFEKIALSGNLTDYSTTPSSYVGTIDLSTVSHYRYDLSAVGGLKSTQMQIGDSTTGSSGEVDSLPGRTYTTHAQLLAPFQARSAAVRTGTFSGTGTLFNLTDTLDSTSEYGGFITVMVKAGTGFSSSAKVSIYELAVSKAQTGSLTPIAQSGYLTGATTTDPSFAFSRSGNVLQCTPIDQATGQPFTFTATARGNLVIG